MVKRSREDSVASSSSSTDSLLADASSRTTKYTQVANEPPSTEVMQCSLPPHLPLSFSTYADYEVHYSQSHTNRCTECRKNFPTDHFLNLHIGENHDPLNEALKAKGEKTVLLPPMGSLRISSLEANRLISTIASSQTAKRSAPTLKNGACTSLTNMFFPKYFLPPRVPYLSHSFSWTQTNLSNLEL